MKTSIIIKRAKQLWKHDKEFMIKIRHGARTGFIVYHKKTKGTNCQIIWDKKVKTPPEDVQYLGVVLIVHTGWSK